MDKQRKQALRAQAHHLKPVVMIGAKGCTETVLTEAERALDAHELIKVKVQGVLREDMQALIDMMSSKLNAQFIQKIGNILVLYRKRDT